MTDERMHPAYYWRKASEAFAKGEDWVGNEYVKVARALEGEERTRAMGRVLMTVGVCLLVIVAAVRLWLWQ